jgi:hypothetical protein
MVEKKLNDKMVKKVNKTKAEKVENNKFIIYLNKELKN